MEISSTIFLSSCVLVNQLSLLLIRNNEKSGKIQEKLFCSHQLEA